MFESEYKKILDQMGENKYMVLSTAVDNKVTSRMMSIIIMNGIMYFQVDCKSRKYKQLVSNKQASLCFSNIQIEGFCSELGKPSDYKDFCDKYKEYYQESYERYTLLVDERLFRFNPVFIKSWIYEYKEPYELVFEIPKKSYTKIKYSG